MAHPKARIYQEERTRAGRHRQVPAPSIEREPWRVLRPSLAIQFVSEKRTDWSPEALSGATQSDVTSALEARNRARLDLVKVDQATFDLVRLAETLSSYRGILAGVEMARRFNEEALRKLAFADGPLAAERDSILELVEMRRALEKRYGIFANGFIKVREKRSGEIVFGFERQGRRSSMIADEVREEAANLSDFAARAATIAQRLLGYLERSFVARRTAGLTQT